MISGAGTGKLNQALKNLNQCWEDTKTRWKDPVSLAFEENHMIPLERQLITTLRAMDRLALAMNKAYRECS
jgi:hypothetical protein